MNDLEMTLMADLRAKSREARESGDPLDRIALRRMAESLLTPNVDERELQRRRLRHGSGEEGDGDWALSGRHVVRSGKYAGLPAWQIILADSLMRHTRHHAGTAQAHRIRPTSEHFEKALQQAWQLEGKGHPLFEGKALDSVTGGAGDELVPTLMANSLWEDIHLTTEVARRIGTQPMPSNPFTLPYEFGDMTWRKGAANTTTTATDPATANKSITAYEAVGEIDWSYDLDEEAVIAVMPNLTEMVRRTGAELIDDVIINADASTGSANINNNGAAISADSRYLLGFDGILHKALVDNTAQGASAAAALLITDFKDLVKDLGKYGLSQARNCLFMSDIYTYADSLGLDDFITVDKAGPGAATILNGAPGSVFTIPFVPTGQMSLAAIDGKVSSTGGNNVKGRLALFNTRMYLKGFVRELLIEVDRDIQRRQTILVASIKVGLISRGTDASQIHTALKYNITV